MIYFIGFKFSLLKSTLMIYWVTKKKKIKIKLKLGIVSNMDQTINLNFGFLHVTVILWGLCYNTFYDGKLCQILD